MYLDSCLMLCVLGVLFVVQNVVATGQWTYATTSSTCAGTYADPCGPSYWGNIAPNCNLNSQSPIDISDISIRTNLSQPTFTAVNGGCTTWVQFSNNYTFEVAFVDAGFTCTNFQLNYASQTYTLQQIHFHSPSEHTIGGGYASAEAHLVHKNSQGNLLVLGILLQAQAGSLTPSNNTFLQTLWNAGEGKIFNGEFTEVSDSAVKLNPYNGLFPGRMSTFRYNGSLTVPPCSENVQWFIFDEFVPISLSDLSILRKAASVLKTTVVSANGNTNRYPQPSRNGRPVYYVSGDATSTTTVVDSNDDDSNDDDTQTALSVSIASIVISGLALFAALAALIQNYHLNLTMKNSLMMASSSDRGGGVAMQQKA